jgi:hypothetical protein
VRPSKPVGRATWNGQTNAGLVGRPMGLEELILTNPTNPRRADATLAKVKSVKEGKEE